MMYRLWGERGGGLGVVRGPRNDLADRQTENTTGMVLVVATNGEGFVSADMVLLLTTQLEETEKRTERNGPCWLAHIWGERIEMLAISLKNRFLRVKLNIFLGHDGFC